MLLTHGFPLLLVALTILSTSVDAFPNFAKLMEPGHMEMIQKRFDDADQDTISKSFTSMFDKVGDLKAYIPAASCKDQKLEGMSKEKIYKTYNLYRKTTTTTTTTKSSSSSGTSKHQFDAYNNEKSYTNSTSSGSSGGSTKGQSSGSTGTARCNTADTQSSTGSGDGLLGGILKAGESLAGAVVAPVLDTIFGVGGEDAAHPWQAPGPNDKRGPCPGLNTIANHGYIPRNGIVNPLELVTGTFLGLHLSPDLSAFLAALSFVGMGDLTTMSLSIGSNFGLGDGLNHHGILEGDASVTRHDHYFGNSWDAQPELVEEFIKETNTYGNGNVDVISLANSRYRAWNWSRNNNPYFDFNPWRMLVAYAESGFVHEVLRGNFETFNEAMIRDWFVEERFPPCWTPRTLPMSAPELLAWASTVFIAKPTVPGWSIGKKGSFIPLPTTNGTYQELKSFFDPATTGATVSALFCAAGNAAIGFFPSQVTNLLSSAGFPAIGSPISCPNLG